jgi:hypothetical protein
MNRKTCFTIHLLTQSLFSLKSSKPVASTSLITHRDPSAHWISNLEWTVLIPPTQESRHAAISVANSYTEVKSPYKMPGLQQHKIGKTNIYLLRSSSSVSPLSKKGKCLSSCSPPSILVLCYLSPINNFHLSYVILYITFPFSLASPCRLLLV